MVSGCDMAPGGAVGQQGQQQMNAPLQVVAQAMAEAVAAAAGCSVAGCC